MEDVANEVPLGIARARGDAAHDRERGADGGRKVVRDSLDCLVGLDGEPRRVGRGLRGLRTETGDGAGLEVARPYPAHPSLVGHVAEHRARAFERSTERATLHLVDRAVPSGHEPQRDDRHVPHLARLVSRSLRRRSVRVAAIVRLRRGIRERGGRGRLRVVLRRRHRVPTGDLRLVRDELADRLLERRRIDEDLPHERGARDRGGELAAGRETVLGARRKEPKDDRLELLREIARVRARWLDAARAHDLEQRVSGERAVEGTSREAFPEDDAQGVEVAPAVDLLSAGLLGRHVPELALENAGLLVDEPRARDPEVGDLHGALEREEDVLRGDVAVDDVERGAALVALLVGVVKALRGLRDDPCARPSRKPRRGMFRSAHQLAEVAALDPLHGEDVPVLTLVRELVDLDDVRVVQPGRELGLVDEHRPEPTRRRVPR